MKTLRYAFWVAVAICLVTVGLANRGMVTVRAMPNALADLFGISPTIDLPLFVVILSGVAVGLLVGLVWEWIREYGERAENRAKTAEIARLKRELGKMQVEKSAGKDEVLALLDITAGAKG
jgi:lipopolysaccharide assembly protein A